MLAGSAHPVVLVAMVVAGTVGVLAMWREDRVLTGYLVATIVVGSLAIVAARPNWIMNPPVLARYIVPVLPILLLFVARGIVVATDRFVARWQWPVLAPPPPAALVLGA